MNKDPGFIARASSICRVAVLVMGAAAIGCAAGEGSNDGTGGSASKGGDGGSQSGHSTGTGGSGAASSTGGAPGSGGVATGGMPVLSGSGGAAGSGAAGSNVGSGGAGGAPTGASGGRSGMGGAVGGSAGAFHAAEHPKLPEVVTLGGAVLSAPKVLPILYGSDKGSADIKAFLKELAASSAWTEQTSEYGVGPLTVLPAVTVTGTAPATISDESLQSMIGSNTSGSKAWGALDPKTIYLFVMPEGTIETEANDACCSGYDGYHADAKVGTKVVPYAVACACPAFGGASLTTLQGRTVAISHELVEAATDPYPNTDPAYVQEDDDDIVWTLVTDGEVADMCEFNDDANFVPDGAKYMIQRTWSNAAAARGDNPCVPSATATPYLNSFPAMSRITDSALGAGGTTLGLKIPIGQKKTIPLTLSSAGPTSGSWTVRAYDYDETVLGSTAGLTFSLDKPSGRNGDTIQLTITAKKADSQIGGEAFLIVSTYGKPGDADYETQLTMGLVTN